ncbi:phage tail protein [Brenneria alni]|uniref:Phage tail protein n=1 Tax=Brenneria alni TaxID=71656 RepID=A0A421DNM5_9GAMM|nr:phage tail protein [Brenneria alni]RLM23686.1 phage tail protein [Brenneria alni]
MLKAESLRAALTEKNRWCKANPEGVTVWVEKGSIEIAGDDSSFMYRYPISVFAMDYPGNIDDLTLPILDWIRVNQPDLLLNPDKNKLIEFDADIANDDTADVLFKIPVWERVIVTRDEDGAVTAEHLAEPRPRLAGGEWDAVFEGEMTQEARS